MRYAVLDIESRALVNDWEKPWEAGCSVACLWTSWPASGRFRIFSESRLPRLLEWVRGADLLVTYNGNRYDCPAIEGIAGGFPSTPRCDLWEILRASLGWKRGPKLEEVARATLGRGKSGHGDGAPQLWAEGRIDELHSYCLEDVSITRDLYLYAAEHGLLWTWREGRRLPVPVQIPGSDAIYQPPETYPHTPATDRQLSYLRRLRPDWSPLPGFSKRQAGEMIDRILERRA